MLLGLTGLKYPEFPGSAGRALLVMLTTRMLVAATLTASLTAAVVTAVEKGEVEGAPSGTAGTVTRANSVQLTADPSGQLAYDSKRASVERGKFTLRLINRSRIPHNVTIGKGAKVLARTKTIQGATTSATATFRVATTSSSAQSTPIAKPAWRAR